MALNSDNVRVAVTGAVYADLTGGATAPTGTAGILTGFDDLGYVSEDGVTLTLPEAGDATPIKVWQNGATVRVVRSSSDENPQLSFTLVETKLEVIEYVFGVTVTQTAIEGSFEFDVQQVRDAVPVVLDVVDGAELIRIHAPQPVVTSIGELSLTSDGPISYNVTVDLERDNTAGYNFKSWMTALKS
jgi:hypothetical protein